jgi:cell division protein DivIC
MVFDDEKIHEEDLSADIREVAEDKLPKVDPTPGSGRQRIMRILINKFLLTFLAFVVWVVFFDNNNLIFRKRVKSEIRQMELQREYFIQEIRQNLELRDLLTNDLDAVEAFGREKYLMKRPNEDIYLIIEDQ